jgi:hypothetical protein
VKVDSPVGNFPFEPQRLRVEDRRLLLEGEMGAWPATVEIEPHDVLTLARLDGVRRGLLLAGALGALAMLRRVGRRAG